MLHRCSSARFYISPFANYPLHPWNSGACPPDLQMQNEWSFVLSVYHSSIKYAAFISNKITTLNPAHSRQARCAVKVNTKRQQRKCSHVKYSKIKFSIPQGKICPRTKHALEQSGFQTCAKKSCA